MAAVANLKQAHVALPKIPVAHSAQHKVKDVTKLTVESQPVVPNVGEAGERPSRSGLPAVHLSLDGSTAKPKNSSYLRRSLTSVPMVTSGAANQSKRSELKSSWLKANDVKNPFQYTVEELNEIVHEKITSGFHGLKHLFRSHTANGNGLVSREGLHRILIGVCGYISKDLFDRYMKKLSLQHDQYVSFEMFITKFPDNEVVRKEWLLPIQQAKVTQEAANYPEQHFRKTSRVIRSNIAPASFFVLFLKDLVKKGKFKPELHLPDSVRNGKEELLKLHLRHVVTKLSGYDITDSELDKLWFRFDQRGVGSVPGEEFCKMIGYDQLAGTSKAPGYDQPLTASVPMAMSRTPSELQGRTTAKTSSPSPEDVGEDLTQAMENSLAAKKVSKLSPSRKNETFTSVIEEIIYRLELPSLNLIAAFAPFDVLKDNFVSKVDFRRVLKQFGFPIGALDLETFLSMNSLRVLNDLIEYKDFVRNFTNRENFGPVNKIVNDPQHVFNTEPQRRLKREGSGVEGWSAEELEAGLVEYFMGSYVKLLLSLRNMDTKQTRLLPEGKIKPLLESILGRQFQRDEWKYLLSTVGLTEDGHIPYENIIAVINNRRPNWNEKNKLGHRVTVIRRPATTLELERLREGIRKEQTMHTHFSPLDNLRSLDDMSIAIRELMKTRFRALDYAYRYQDRKMTGRLDKHMLRRILQECGVDFEPKEMDKLWGTFALAPDGLYTWSKFCQRYVSDQEKLKQASQAEERKEENLLTSAAGLRAIPEEGRETANQVARPSSKITDPVLTKIKFEVVSNFESLESLFKDLDVQRRGHVTLEEAKETFKVLKIRVAAEELKHICQLFDLEGSSRFHYKTFLSLYKPRPPSRLRMQSRQSLTKQPTFVRPSSKMSSNRLVQQLKGKEPEMRRQFKKSDPLGQGVISVRDFKFCLEQLGINCSSDDSFSEVASTFDHSLRGQINYEDFSALCRP